VRMHRLVLVVGLVLAAVGRAQAQWEIETSNTTADLRGIHSVGDGVAWASGTNGTVLRTEDGGYVWQGCAVPPGAEKLDFRGVQGFDANTAIVMSSGKGALSRLYKTTDGCHTWKLILTNPDAEGFWDAVKFRDPRNGFLLGDPVNGRFVLMGTHDGGEHWLRAAAASLKAATPESGAFAASNSSLLFSPQEDSPSFVTGGPGGALFYGGVYASSADGTSKDAVCSFQQGKEPPADCITSWLGFQVLGLSLKGDSASSGGFSIAAAGPGKYPVVVVGGDYAQPEAEAGSAAYLHGRFETFLAVRTMPHGYRSSVAYDAATKTWVTVGPNGTDISADDGKNWRALRPDPALHEAPDADLHWNAISLPFVVGPKGRIGKLNPASLKR
jgi:hypothetical protein